MGTTVKNTGKPLKIESVFKPHIYQTEVFKGMKRFNVIKTCRGWGKTVAAVMKLHDSCMRSQKVLDFAYIAPVKSQVWDVIAPVVYEFLGHLQGIDKASGLNIIDIKDSRFEIHYNNGCKIKAYGADQPNCRVIRGKTFGGVVVDEFDSCSLEVWRKIIRPCLRTHKGWALLIGTIEPGSNLCSLAAEMGDEPDWQVKTYKLSECWQDLPAYDEDEYLSLQKEYADVPNIYAREYECDESASDEDAVIPMQLINMGKGKHIPKETYSGLVKVLGVDVATGYGADKSSICKRHGLVCEFTKYNLENMDLADKVALTINEWQPDAVFIDKGRGEGVISRLRQLGYQVIGIDFGGKASNSERYANKRVEMYHDGVRKYLENGGSIPDERLLIQDLATPLLKKSEGKFLMESKKEIKKRIGRSPDDGDSLALTFAAPVRKKEDTRNLNSKNKATLCGVYKPLQRMGSMGRRHR